MLQVISFAICLFSCPESERQRQTLNKTQSQNDNRKHKTMTTIGVIQRNPPVWLREILLINRRLPFLLNSLTTLTTQMPGTQTTLSSPPQIPECLASPFPESQLGPQCHRSPLQFLCSVVQGKYGNSADKHYDAEPLLVLFSPQCHWGIPRVPGQLRVKSGGSDWVPNESEITRGLWDFSFCPGPKIGMPH